MYSYLRGRFVGEVFEELYAHTVVEPVVAKKVRHAVFGFGELTERR